MAKKCFLKQIVVQENGDASPSNAVRPNGSDLIDLTPEDEKEEYQSFDNGDRSRNDSFSEVSSVAIVDRASGGEVIDDDDYLVVPMPDCFDLNKPFNGQEVVTPTKSSRKMSITDGYDKTEDDELQSLAESMENFNTSGSINSKIAEAPAVSQIQGSATTTSTTSNLSPYYMPSPPVSSLVRQVASVNDSEPVVRQPQGPMEQLIEMGFANRNRNEALLKLYCQDVQKVVTHLINSDDRAEDFYR